MRGTEQNPILDPLVALGAIVETSDDAIIATTLEGIVVSWNAAAERIYGYTVEETRGRMVSVLVPEDRQDEVPAVLLRIAKGERVEAYDTIRRRKDGTLADVSATISPLKDRSGTIFGASIISRDVTERVKAQSMLQEALDREQLVSQKLRNLDKLKDDFVAMIAHDLRSPLSVITGFAQILLQRWEALSDVQKQDFLSKIIRNSEEVGALADDILEIARIEYGEFSYVIQPFDLGVMVRRAAEELGSGSPQRILAVVPSDLPLALGDENRHRQVLTNLVSNALKFSSKTAPVEIEIKRDGVDMLHVAVRDRGVGIDPDDIPTLFEKFRRVSRPGETARKGIGLGLYICKQMVEGQSGRLWAEPRAGGGMIFTYSIPAAKKETP